MVEKQQNYTEAGLKALKDELEYLRNVKREEIKKEISTARSFGDLSENSEYDEAKNEQAKNEARIAELESMIREAHVVDESEIDRTVVNVGSTVTVYNETRNKRVVYQLVGSYETDPLKGKISDVSPIGRALIGGKVGDRVTAEIPAGQLTLLIEKIERV
jgi:transcription elongation factor GreA